MVVAFEKGSFDSPSHLPLAGNPVRIGDATGHPTGKVRIWQPNCECPGLKLARRSKGSRVPLYEFVLRPPLTQLV